MALKLAKVLDREDLAPERHEPETVRSARLEIAELEQHDQRRRRRAPDRQLTLRDELRELSRLFRKLLRDQVQGGAMPDARIDILNRCVEMEGRMAAEPVGLGRFQDRGAPVEET